MLKKSTISRMNPSFHWFFCIGIFAFSGITAHAQPHTTTESIRLHGSMAMGDAKLSLTLVTKGQNKLRATIQGEHHQARVHITYNQEQLWTKQSINGSESIRKLEGKEGAENLLDLLAINPEFHFKEKDGFNLNCAVFQGYKVEYTQSEKPYKDTDKHIPESLTLFEIRDGESRLIRSIRYISFQKETTPFIQPKELSLIDELTGEIVKIVIHKTDYNTPLPDFLFKLSETK